MQKSRLEKIKTLLNQGLSPSKLLVEDDSAKHAGHAGASPEGETHYNIFIVSKLFEGKNRVERHRIINNILKDEFNTGLHALAIKAKTESEVSD